MTLLEAEPEPGLAASGTNSGIVHTGFDSAPGELETRLILRSAELRDPVLEALGIPVLRCGALLRPGRRRGALDRGTAGAERRAQRGGGGARAPTARSGARRGRDRSGRLHAARWSAPRERLGAEVRTGWRVAALRRVTDGLELEAAGGERLRARVIVNCAGLHADEVARTGRRRLVRDLPAQGGVPGVRPARRPPLERILLPVPTAGTKGVLVFPTLDGKVVAGPTAVDREDKDDWSVRPEAAERDPAKAVRMYPPLEGAEPIAAYAGLRPAGRGVNYADRPVAGVPGLVNVAAIRSTGLTASLGDRRARGGLVAGLGVRARRPRPPLPSAGRRQRDGPWWRRTAEFRAAA